MTYEDHKGFKIFHLSSIHIIFFILEDRYYLSVKEKMEKRKTPMNILCLKGVRESHPLPQQSPTDFYLWVAIVE